MRTFDLSPFYRSAIGFDRLAGLFDELQRSEAQPSYPPYNIERVDEDRYRITMAVAGFSEADLEIQVEGDSLTVSGRKPEEQSPRTYLHHGIAAREFRRQFRLADHVQVSGARLEHGLLHVELKRELPEAMKPRTIAIESTSEQGRLIEDQAA